MNIRINEQDKTIADDTTLASLANEFKPGADVLILNGFPAPADTPVYVRATRCS